MKLRDLWPWLLALALLILSAMAVNDAFGQEFEAEAEVGTELWGAPDRCYQHAFWGRAEASISVGPVTAQGHIKRKTWMACDAKIASSPLNAEAGKVNEQAHGGRIFATYKWLDVGFRIHRVQIHHIWRHKRSRDNRHNHFPGSWRIGVEAAQTGSAPSWPDDKPQRPSIGYHDELGGFLRVRYAGLMVSGSYLPVRWKSLTLIPVDIRLNAKYECGPWEIDLHAERDLLNEWSYDVSIERRVLPHIYLGVRAGHIQTPDWQPSFTRFATAITIR